MATPQVVVMGVSGCGKSTVGQALAQALGVAYVEGDALHPPANVARMAAGIALTDADRQGWLQAVAQRLGDQPARTQGVVVACSALKRSYRDLLRAAAPAMRLVYLDGDAALIAQRLASRQGHYMPPSLLQSQLDTLQPPEADEYPLVLDIAQPPEALVARAAQALRETVA
jgi:gluconokinase